MARGKNTKEYQTVKKSYPNLSDAIASVIEKACERLLAAGLINDGQRAAASNGFVDARNRASTVTGLLLNKVEQDTKYFQMLVDVLQQDMDTFGTVLEQMGITVNVDHGHASGSKGSGAGDLSLSLKRSTESDVLQRFHAELNSSITDPDLFAAQLIQHKFTTEQIADNKMPLGVPNFRKVGNLLGIVNAHIGSVSSVSPERVKERFMTLLLILRNKLGLDDLAQQMETECYGTQQAHPAPSKAPSSLNGSPTGGVSKEEAPNGNKRTKLEERVENDGETDVPRVLCTMEFTPKMKSPPAALAADPGFASAALPCESGLWRKKELKVQIKNRHLLGYWKVNLGKFMECANRWSDGAVSERPNYIPRFEMIDNEDPDIVVELNEKKENKSAIGHVEGQGPTQVYLDLEAQSYYQEHLIVHEFGHVLGLGHEHQRSDFWSWIKDYIDENKMKKDPDMRGRFVDWQCKDDLMAGGATAYDSDSVMHYWFKTSWLTQGYSDKEYLDKQSKFLSKELKAALHGIHKRDGNVVTKPSRVDLDFLSAKYKKVFDGTSDSRIFPDDEEPTTPDHENDTMVHGPHQPGPSGSASARLDLKEEKVKDPVEPKAPLKFSDSLSPNDLVAWLSQELVARSLTLDDAPKDKLIEEQINGKAFKVLSEGDLKEIGFKMGPRKNILEIIGSEDLNK